MIDLDIWNSRVRDALRHFWDEDYQRRAWTDRGPEVSSFDEVLSRLFDDLQFDEYLKSRAGDLTPLQRECSARFVKSIGSLNMNRLRGLKAAEVIADADWSRVRERAKNLAVALFGEE